MRSMNCAKTTVISPAKIGSGCGTVDRVVDYKPEDLDSNPATRNFYFLLIRLIETIYVMLDSGVHQSRDMIFSLSP